jgi:hypothetical protein
MLRSARRFVGDAAFDVSRGIAGWGECDSTDAIYPIEPSSA